MPRLLMPPYNEYIRLIEERLSKSKARHCRSVAAFLEELAPSLELDIAQAVTAGLLHDYCRADKGEKLLDKARRYALPISAFALQKPNLLHGPVAAEECRRKLGLEDDAIYEAIYWHTTGRPGLGLLGRALYFADFAEPGRSYPEAREARKRLAADGFNVALLWVAETKIGFLQEKNVADPITGAFYAWLEQGAP